MRLLPKRTLTTLVALCALGSSACVKQNAPGVGIVKFDSSAVFGLAPAEPPAVPDFSLPTSFDDTSLDFSGNVLPKPPVADAGVCPPAKLTAFPKQSATVKVIGKPPEGLYTWKRDSLIIKDASPSSKQPLPVEYPFKLESRVIRRVVTDSDHQFQFEMLAPDPLTPENTVITTFRVNTNPALLADRSVSGRTVGVVDVPGADVRVTDPTDEPGIFIVQQDVQNEKGVDLSSFHPVQPVLIAPLEGGVFRTGQTFRSFGIDATSATLLAVNGTVGRTSRVDACGEIVEGYTVDLHEELSTDVYTGDLPGGAAAFATRATRQETREVSYNFASQYGALPIGEGLVIGDIAIDPVAVSGKWELGGLTPMPIPDSAK